MHAPGCSCARLARTRGRHAAEGRASGYVVASRDAKAPDLHFGSDERDFGKRPEKSEGAPAGPGERTAQRPAADRGEDAALRRRREALLSDAIADAVKREANGPARVSCAACMLDGAWRNGAIAVAGPPERVGAACAAANRALFGDFAGRFPPAGMWHGRGAPVCVPISVRGLLQSRALGCVEIKILRRVRADSSRRPPRHRRDACSMAWRRRFLTARPSQNSRVIAEK